MKILVVDLFAGPGGLGEGFASFKNEKKCHPFKISLCIEKDFYAHRTLELRSFFRQFENGGVPNDYYKYLRGKKSREELFKNYPREARRAQNEAWHATLGETSEEEIDDRIFEATSAYENIDKWLLLGGPPCQAYSLAGRSRIIGEDKKKKTNNYENDHRHHLYREYLRILAVHSPPVFVMENVKGILSSEVRGERIFKKIISDMKSPVSAIPRRIWPKYLKRDDIGYEIFPLVQIEKDPSLIEGAEFVVKCEDYGIPQARHRVFLLGIRADINILPGGLRKKEKRTVNEAISDLPPIRSLLSREADSLEGWRQKLKSIAKEPWLSDVDKDIQKEIIECVKILPNLPFGDAFVKYKYLKRRVMMEKRWFYDAFLNGYCNHESRAHIRDDLKRYLYAACFARIKGRSPKILDFPKALYPDHRNVQARNEGRICFDNRFHVQLSNAPSTTVVSHISQDGHYFIHPDPLQCRSLTVREVARLQTFPDNYFFEGARTQQYQQVGNAVPPLLAMQIAEIVYEIFNRYEEELL